MLEHWNILVGRQPLQNIGLRTEDGWDISGDDVQIWLEEQGENSFALSAYCEKLLPMLREAEGRVWWMLTTLTDQVLGEISHMWYIDDFNVLEEPKAEQSFLLSQLPDKLKEKGANLSTDPEAYLNSYLGYKMEPNKDPEADWRLDVMAGSTCCVPLINGYLNADNDYMDALHADGAVAGFLCYPLDTLREEEGSEKIFNFRDRLEEALTAGDGPEVLTLTGGATGIYCGYVDFIAWDIRAALQMAKEFFEDSDIPWANFHTFRREAGTVNLKTPAGGGPHRRGRPGGSHPHRRGHRHLLRLCGFHRLGHPGRAPDGKGVLRGQRHPLGQLPHLPPGGGHSEPENAGWRRPSPPGTARRFSPSPAGPPAFTAAMWISSPGTSGPRSRWQRSSSRTATSPGPTSTPSAGRRAQ